MRATAANPLIARSHPYENQKVSIPSCHTCIPGKGIDQNGRSTQESQQK